MENPQRFVVMCLAALMLPGMAFAGTPEDAAQAAAEPWLALVDSGQYAASWGQAAPVLKEAVKQDEWAEIAAGVRADLGQLVSRKVKSREYTEKAPTTSRVVGGRVYTWGGPGRYVIIQYDSRFADKASVVEAVIVMETPDGAWRVAAYSAR
jgi:hypothetical protein